MKLIVGLGNPGERYETTRHNAGFLFVDALREKFVYENGFNVSDWRKEDTFDSEICFIKKGSTIIAILQKPLTFMNRSGIAVKKLMRKFDLENISSDFILAHDDLDIDLGKLKIQEGKSPKGHNGVRDVEERLKRVDFRRIRLGVENREDKNIPGDEYVLMRFTDDEMVLLNEAIDDAIKGIMADILYPGVG